MIPVQQTTFHDPKDDGKGNCFMACLASLLEVPIHAVPDFIRLYRCTNYMVHIQHWLSYYDLELDSTFNQPADNVLTHYIVSGPSPRNPEVWHACIWYGGKIVHDPHPDNAGLLEPLEWQWLKKVRKYK